MFENLVKKNTKLAVVGLGYVGLPLALEFAKKLSVIGFDINENRLNLLRSGIDPNKEIDSDSFYETDITFTSIYKDMKDASFFIIAVPTPIDNANKPDLTPLLSATKLVAQILKKGDYVVYESTVYPGCTEDDCVPLLESISGLKMGIDFKVGYSPERINPGDKVNTLTNTIKIVSGCDSESLSIIANVYKLIIQVGVHLASNIKVAEAGKIIENTQRDVNIALMNELSIICNKIGINTYEVLEAAGTKWNFLKFSPGLVGGHCIGVDPYYLVHKSNMLKYHPQIINAGRFVNDSMGGYIAKKLVKNMMKLGISPINSKVLIMGITFKENVSDIRNSKVLDILNELNDYGIRVDVVDSMADADEVMQEYGVKLHKSPSSDYDAIILAVSHEQYLNIDESYFKSITNTPSIFFDIKGVYRNRISKLNYWSL